MAKLVKLIVTVGILVGIGYGVFLLIQSGDKSEAAKQPTGEPPMHLEEKYGFTSETVGG